MTSPLRFMFWRSGNRLWFMFWRVGSALSSVNAFRVMKGA